MTQDALAEKLGVTFQAVSKWENGLAMPDITFLPRLSEIFGVTVDSLFGLAARQSPKTENIPSKVRVLDWDDDGVLRAVLFVGNRITDRQELTETKFKFTFEYDGTVRDVISDFSVSCGDVEGNVTTEVGNINCSDIDGDVSAESGNINCSDIGGDATTASGSINCCDIDGDATTASGSISCGDIGGGCHHSIRKHQLRRYRRGCRYSERAASNAAISAGMPPSATAKATPKSPAQMSAGMSSSKETAPLP